MGLIVMLASPIRFVKTTLCILCSISMLALTASAQTARFVGESLVITDGQRRIRLSDVIGPHPIARCVHAVQKGHREYFVLISARMWSRGYPPRSGYCGAGVESYIEWLQVRDGKIAKRAKGLVKSCFDNRDGGITGWRGTIFTAETTDLVENRDGPADAPARWRDITFTFDAAHPQKGINQKEAERKAP